MRLLRHGIFARQTKNSRKLRALRISGLAVVAAIAGFVAANVFADNRANMENLTNNNISGTFYDLAGNNITAAGRDDALKLDIAFPIADAQRTNASGGQWQYDLSSYINQSGIPFSNLVNTTEDVDVMYQGNPVGVYRVVNNVVQIDITDNTFKDKLADEQISDVELDVSVKALLDPLKIGTKESTSGTNLNIPGTPAGTQSQIINYESVDADVYEEVRDATGSWLGGNTGITLTKNQDNSYTAEYSINASSNAWINDGVIDITVDNGQTIDTSSFYIDLCDTWSHCAYSDADRVAITSNYINPISSTHVQVKIADLLKNTSLDYLVDQNYNISFNANIPSGSNLSNTYSSTAEIRGTYDQTGESNHLFDTSTVSFSAADTIPSSKTGWTEGDFVFYRITIGDGTTSLNNLEIYDQLSDNQNLSSDIYICDSSIAAANCTNTNYTRLMPSANVYDRSGAYSVNLRRLFDYTFPSDAGNGPYTITYRTTIATDAELDGTKDVKNRVMKVINGHDYFGGEYSTPYNFPSPAQFTYIEKEFVSENINAKTIDWTITINTADEDFTNAVIDDWFDIGSNNELKSHVVNTVTGVDSNPSGIPYSTSTDNNGMLTISFPAINKNDTIVIHVRSTYDNYFSENGLYEQLMYNTARLQVDGAYVDQSSDTARINHANPYDMEKTGTVINSVDSNTGVNTARIEWKVLINKYQTEMDPDAAGVWFVDQLPENVQLQTCGNDPCINMVARIIGYNWETSSNIVVPVNGRMVGPIDLYDLFPSTSHPDQKLSGVEYQITYSTEIDSTITDDYATAHSFTNTAYVRQTENGVNENSAAATVEYKYPEAVRKTDTSPDNLENDIIKYEIEINPHKKTLNGGNDIVVSDTISDKVELLTGEAKLYDENDNLVTTYPISYDSASRSLTVTVPDNTSFKLKYRVIANNVYIGKNDTYINTAVLTTNTTSFASPVSKSHTIGGISGKITGELAIYIKKIERDSINTVIENVGFMLTSYDYTDEQNNDFTVASHTDDSVRYTDSDGLIEYKHLTPLALYSWKEVSAPANYTLANTSDHYFIFYESANGQQLQANIAAANARAQAIEAANGWTSGTVKVMSEGDVLSVTNEKRREVLPLTVTKTVKGNWAETDRNFEFTLTLSDAGAPVTSTIVYEKGNDSGVMNVTNGTLTFSLKHGESITFSIPENMTYAVSETVTADYTTTTPANASGTMTQAVTLNFENTRQYNDIPTGVKFAKDHALVICMIAGASFMLLTTYFATKFIRRA